MAVNDIKRMEELNELLAKAADAYYNTGVEIMSDKQYDDLYDELEALEKKTGVILSGSRTQTVGYEVSSALQKIRHTSKMLSLDKTKSVDELESWLGEHKGFLSWKLDGLTLVLTYEGGELIQAVTRGNGEIGEDITANARHIKGIPARIPFSGRMVVRGESLMKYKDFEKVNAEIEDGAKYKNPRNLCVGTVRNLDSRVTAERNINFFAFNLVSAEGYDENSFSRRLDWLEELGFQRVYGVLVDSDSVRGAVADFEKSITENEFPSDGLVLMYDDVAYGLSLGETSHAPRNGIAFKWRDETADTTLREVEWSASRTGLLNPVAIFDPVELEGTTVSRASVHNLSIVKQLRLGIGDTLTIFKANMIIPQVLENKTGSGSLEIPAVCPVCGAGTEVRTSDDDVETLVCPNKDCAAKHIGKFEHFVQRDAMNIVGMSTATIETLVSEGFVREFRDFYHLDDHKFKIVTLEGFGEKSYQKLKDAVEASRKTELSRVLYALGIPNIGRQASRLICGKYTTAEEIEKLSTAELTAIDGIGEVLANDYVSFFRDERNLAEFHGLLEELEIAEAEAVNGESAIAGKTFVITGSVHIWKNRNELKAFIEQNGGKAAGSVSSKTDYLINNDSLSNSTKNKTAKELGVPIITEEEFQALISE
ncbi:NAD-dependent DNA ligase LigA [Ruminococcus flavefaciens]|uniref:NAD-dependent DNA ligase LigA n=1 Tax=Ruminococcus flavefaciens TaxID=1265 RepID=UPI0026F004D2|nr:NAD-dependent DNA ligase LigA [Ruminococcus flavefaciens]MDD7516545.1 NAD-dependent DNA ligase LigA [Ruminococcus flavefaciens]MDY5691731.1 NAD-dependent DNA ligase LigA [Ruminococcus flavefaciens]